MYTPEQLKEMEWAYNEGARLWNSLPGPKLKWPEDRFKIKYCYCEERGRVGDTKYGPVCYECGYPIHGE